MARREGRPGAKSKVELEQIGDLTPVIDALEAIAQVRALRIDAAYINDDTFGFSVWRIGEMVHAPSRRAKGRGIKGNALRAREGGSRVLHILGEDT